MWQCLGLDETRCCACHAPFPSGSSDAGSSDAGSSDAGSSDAGSSDVGASTALVATSAPLFSIPVSARSPAVSLPFIGLCPSCRAALCESGAFCPWCGSSQIPEVETLHDVSEHTGNAAESLHGVPCGACLAEPPPWNDFFMVGSYKGVLRELVLQGKFYADAASLILLGKLLVHRCAAMTPPDAVVPVPLHSGRLHERGFNQSHELARPLAAFFRVPLADSLLCRRMATPSQRGLSRSERRANLEGVFTAGEAVEGRRVLLVDDVLTTGTTLRHAVLALRKAGAIGVDVAVAARSQGRD